MSGVVHPEKNEWDPATYADWLPCWTLSNPGEERGKLHVLMDRICSRILLMKILQVVFFHTMASRGYHVVSTAFETRVKNQRSTR